MSKPLIWVPYMRICCSHKHLSASSGNSGLYWDIQCFCRLWRHLIHFWYLIKWAILQSIQVARTYSLYATRNDTLRSRTRSTGSGRNHRKHRFSFHDLIASSFHDDSGYSFCRQLKRCRSLILSAHYELVMLEIFDPFQDRSSNSLWGYQSLYNFYVLATMKTGVRSWRLGCKINLLKL